jgi:hypothetical protein
MLPADYPFELRPRRERPLRARAVFAVWISLCVHAAVLLRLLAPATPMPPPEREAPAAAGLQVILLDAPAPPPSSPVATAAPPAFAAEFVPAVPRRERVPRVEPPAPTISTDVPTTAPASAAQLFGSIEGAARAAVAGDPRNPNAGLPSAMARLPGSSEAIVDLPVRFKRRPTPKQIGLFVARIVVGTMAANPDDMESARTLRNPLEDMTQKHIGNLREPECNDPDDPLRDPRCAMAPTR